MGRPRLTVRQERSPTTGTGGEMAKAKLGLVEVKS